jgi:hypothetical protein
LNLGHESRKENRPIAGVVELVDTGDLKFHLYVLPCSI